MPLGWRKYKALLKDVSLTRVMREIGKEAFNREDGEIILGPAPEKLLRRYGLRGLWEDFRTDVNREMHAVEKRIPRDGDAARRELERLFTVDYLLGLQAIHASEAYFIERRVEVARFSLQAAREERSVLRLVDGSPVLVVLQPWSRSKADRYTAPVPEIIRRLDAGELRKVSRSLALV
jgi:hypothetical protein